MSYDQTIFKSVTLSNLFEEIYNNQKSTKSRLENLIGSLKDLILTAHDAATVVPLIKEYMDIGVKNDEQLIKMATIIQRIESAASKNVGGMAEIYSDLEILLDENEAMEKQQQKLLEESKQKL